MVEDITDKWELSEMSEELKAEFKMVLTEYLPFIDRMRTRAKGTSVEIKWKLMRDSLVKPKKKFTIQTLQHVRKMLSDLQTKEDVKMDEGIEPSEDEQQNQNPETKPAQNENTENSTTKSITNEFDDTSTLHDSLCEHSYAKSSSIDDSSHTELPQSPNNAMQLSNAENSNQSAKVDSKKLTIDELFSFKASNELNFELSDSEYPLAEEDNENDVETLVNSKNHPEKVPEPVAEVAQNVPATIIEERGDTELEPQTEELTQQSEDYAQDTKKLSPETEKLTHETEELPQEAVDMELDEELMGLDRLIMAQEQQVEATDTESDCESLPGSSMVASSVDTDQEMSESIPETLPPSQSRKDHVEITEELIRELVLLKEMMILKKSDEQERKRMNSDCDSSEEDNSNESLLQEVVKRPSLMKIKLPSAKKRRIESKTRNGKKSEDGDEGFKGWLRSEVEDINDITIIPYQCTIPRPSTKDLQLWVYNTVGSISFAKLKRGFMFKCLLNDCRFQTLVKDTLEEHLETKHSGEEWRGFCNICVDNIGPKKTSIMEEFKHMEVHLELIENNKSQAEPFKICGKSSVFLSPSSLPEDSAVHPTTPVNAKPSLLTQKQPAKAALKKIQSRPVIKNQSSQANKPVPVLTQLPAVSTFQPNSVKQHSKAANILRPWLKAKLFKNQDQAEAMLLSKEALSATYKCMSATCSFFTIDKELFLKHLSFHEKFTASDKVNFLTCSYCEFVASTAVNLADHIDNEHVHDQFQCGYCFYRACAVFTVTTHQALLHESLPSVIIECDLIKPRDTRAHLEKVAKLRADNVPPMICVYCRGIFYVMQAFKEHMDKHNSKKMVKCIQCGENTTNRQLHTHLERCHGMGTFQCVYCNFGTEDFEKLNNHIANNHSSKIPLFCERVWNKNSDGSLKHKSPSVVEATSIKNVKPSLKNHCKKELRKASKDQVLLRNECNVGMLKPTLVIHKTIERNSSVSAHFTDEAVKPTSQAGPTMKPAAQTAKPTTQSVKPGKIQVVARSKPQKIVAQMPKEAPTPSQEISSLLKPLKISNVYTIRDN